MALIFWGLNNNNNKYILSALHTSNKSLTCYTKYWQFYLSCTLLCATAKVGHTVSTLVMVIPISPLAFPQRLPNTRYRPIAGSTVVDGFNTNVHTAVYNFKDTVEMLTVPPRGNSRRASGSWYVSGE